MNIVKIIVMQDSIAVGVSLPKEIITKIDHDRGDISRSRYMLRLLERIYRSQESSQDEHIKKQQSEPRLQPEAYSAASIRSSTYKPSGGFAD